MRYALTAVFIAASCFSNVAICQDDHVAIFKSVFGNVKVIRNKADIPASPGMPVLRADKIVSGTGAAGGIAFRDGTLVTIGPSTELEVSRYQFQPEDAKYDFSLYLKQGTTVYSSGKLGKLSPESVVVNTPKATVGIRGTRFIVEVE